MKIVLKDPQTSLFVEHEPDKTGWSLKEAVAELTSKIVAETGVKPHEVLFNNEPFRIGLSNDS